MPVDLPTDVLREIFHYCDPADITTSCKYFASIAHSIPSLWSRIRLGPHQLVSEEGPEFLSRRLKRAGSEPLEISIGPINDENGSHPTIIRISYILSTFSDAIVLLEISTETALLAAETCFDIFRKSIFPRLHTFSVRVEDDSLITTHPRLDRLLRDGPEKFPMLQTLSLTSFYECLPMPSKGTSFAHLHTLVLDGSLENDPPEMILIVALLHSTPQLEALWIKHSTSDHFSVVPEDNVTPSHMMKGRDDIRSPVFLPRLNRIAVTAPGCALDVLHCINAPALRDLHIDGSRGPFKGTDEQYTVDWTGLETDDVIVTLKRLSLRSEQLRRIAFTSVHIPHMDWKWLLFGRGGGAPPFQLLESIALHGIEETPESERCGFNDALLTRYAKEPIRVPLRRLAFLRCNFPLSGSVVVRAFKTAASSGVQNGTVRELEWGPSSCPQITEDDLNELAVSGVKAICRQDGEVKEDEWWTRGHRVDAFDLHAY